MLTIGMMWFDNNKNLSFLDRILKAVSYYHTKYKKIPNICHINPSIFDYPEIKELEINRIHYNNTHIIAIESDKFIRPEYMWIGIDQDLKEFPINISRDIEYKNTPDSSFKS